MRAAAVWLAAFAINALLILDMAGNMVLLGRPGETISHRCARLREFGGPRWAPTGCLACAALTRLFWFMRRDHCTWALRVGQDMSGTELWRWSK